MPRALAIAASSLVIVTSLVAQQPPPQQSTFGSNATAVVIDVVVRDDKGRPVTGLRQEDFTLVEDGVPQKIGAFVEVAQGDRGDVARAPKRSPSVVAAEKLTEQAQNPAASAPRFLAIVFDRLTAEGRGAAYKGALASLDTLRDGDFVGVFLADQTLVVIQPYTNDRSRIEAAIRDVATRATTRYNGVGAVEDLANRGWFGEVKRGDADPSVPVVASAEFDGRPVDGRHMVEREVGAVLSATRNSWERLQRDWQGYTTTNALYAVVEGLGVLPGRKTLVFFAEGLAIPDAVLPYFRNVVVAANRVNVSAYTIDSAGLRVHSTDAMTGRAVRAMGEAGVRLDSTGANQSSLAMLEYNEDVLRKDPRTSLSLLANQTGGFLVENTNDLADAFRRVDADRRFYYLLTYAPTNTAVDGKWRSVTVSVPKRKVTIRSRTGYAATGGLAAIPTLTFETAALAALERTPAPTELPVRSTALVFPNGRESKVAVLASTDGAALEFHRDGDRYLAEFNIIARILDSKGVVVRKASQPYRLSGAATEMERARAGNVLFFRQPTIEPGAYTLEVAVHDGLTGKVGVRRSTFTVPATEAFDASSLVLVQRAEPVKAEERQADNPLFVDDVVLYPSMGEPVASSSNLALTCLLTLGRLGETRPDVRLELLRDGARVAQGALPLPAPDPSGRVRYLGELSLGTSAAAPGEYVLRLTIVAKGQSVVREAAFTVAAPQK